MWLAATNSFSLGSARSARTSASGAPCRPPLAGALAPYDCSGGVGVALAVEIEAGLVVGRVDVGDAVVVADELGEDDVVENGDDDGLRIRDRFGDNEDRVLEEKLGEDRLQEFLAVDVFGFFGLAERDERDGGVIC